MGKKTTLFVATAIASLLAISSTPASAKGKKNGGFKCEGVNGCKGKGVGGKNDCHGKGITMTKNKAACDELKKGKGAEAAPDTEKKETTP